MKIANSILVIGPTPRFFTPCCKMLDHFDQDFNGVDLNLLIRDINIYLGKLFHKKYGKGGAIHFLSPELFFSDLVWQGLVQNSGRRLLSNDMVHLTKEANDVLTSSLSVILQQPPAELPSFLDGFVDDKSLGLVPGFYDWRISFVESGQEPPLVAAPTVREPAAAPVAARGYQDGGRGGNVRSRLGARLAAAPYNTPAQGRLLHQRESDSKQKGAYRKRNRKH